MCAEHRVGRGVCGLSPGAPRMSLLHTYLDTGSVAIDRGGVEEPGWIREARTPGLSLPSGHVVPCTKDAIRVERETMSALERSVPLSSRRASAPCSSLQERSRLPLAECVHTRVHVCVWSLPFQRCPAPATGALPTRLGPPHSVSLGPSASHCKPRFG